MENYICINGKKVKELTAEQLKILGIEEDGKSIKWKPEEDDRVYYICSGSEVTSHFVVDADTAYNKSLIKYANIYKTQEAAEKAIECDDIDLTFKWIANYVAHNIGDWKADWGDYEQVKYYIYYDYEKLKYKVTFSKYNRGDGIYMNSELASEIVEILNKG